MANKWVYTFGNGSAEGRADMRNLLGGKGANLAEMNLVGLPVPAGFTVTTDVCTYYYENGHFYKQSDDLNSSADKKDDKEKGWKLFHPFLFIHLSYSVKQAYRLRYLA